MLTLYDSLRNVYNFEKPCFCFSQVPISTYTHGVESLWYVSVSVIQVIHVCVSVFTFGLQALNLPC